MKKSNEPLSELSSLASDVCVCLFACLLVCLCVCTCAQRGNNFRHHTRFQATNEVDPNRITFRIFSFCG